MVRCRDTSSRSGKDQLRFGKRERRLTYSIVVEPVLSKEHIPKVLADLVPCLCFVIRVVNRRPAKRGETPFRTLPGRPTVRTKQRKERMWSVNSCSFITAPIPVY